MESSYVVLQIPNRGTHIIRYKYKFNPNNIELHVNGNDLALLLELTNKSNLQELHLQLEIDIVKPDGSTEEIAVILPQEVMLATPAQLRQMEATSPH